MGVPHHKEAKLDLKKIITDNPRLKILDMLKNLMENALFPQVEPAEQRQTDSCSPDRSCPSVYRACQEEMVVP